MKLFKKNTGPERLPHPYKTPKAFLRFVVFVLVVSLMMAMALTAYAVDDPITVVNNLSDFIFGLIRAIGIILLGWGIVQVGMSVQSHDASQRTQGFLCLAGGLIIAFAREILTLITGG